MVEKHSVSSRVGDRSYTNSNVPNKRILLFVILKPIESFFLSILGKVIISALPPIETKGLPKDQLDNFIQKVHHVMEVEYEKLCDEIISKLPEQHPFFTGKTI